MALAQGNRGHLSGVKIGRADLDADLINGSYIADDSIDSEHYVDASIDNAHLAAASVSSAKIVDDTIRPTKLAPRYILEEFGQQGIATENDGTVASGATGATNILVLGRNVFTYHIKGAGQTLIVPTIAADGLLVSHDLTVDEGAEYTNGITSRCPVAFTVGTDGAFFFKCRLKIADVSGTDDCAVGFRKAEAFQAAIDNYDEMAALNVISGNITIETILNNAATTSTDTTDDWTDGQTKTLEVYVSAAGVVTYKIDNAAPTATAAFSFDAGEVVVPFFYFLHDATSPGAIHLVSWEVGFQAEA